MDHAEQRKTCWPCASGKRACDGGRPCGRCLKLDRADKCIDAPPGYKRILRAEREKQRASRDAEQADAAAAAGIHSHAGGSGGQTVEEGETLLGKRTRAMTRALSALVDEEDDGVGARKSPRTSGNSAMIPRSSGGAPTRAGVSHNQNVQPLSVAGFAAFWVHAMAAFCNFTGGVGAGGSEAGSVTTSSNGSSHPEAIPGLQSLLLEHRAAVMALASGTLWSTDERRVGFDLVGTCSSPQDGTLVRIPEDYLRLLFMPPSRGGIGGFEPATPTALPPSPTSSTRSAQTAASGHSSTTTASASGAVVLDDVTLDTYAEAAHLNAPTPTLRIVFHKHKLLPRSIFANKAAMELFGFSHEQLRRLLTDGKETPWLHHDFVLVHALAALRARNRGMLQYLFRGKYLHQVSGAKSSGGGSECSSGTNNSGGSNSSSATGVLRLVPFMATEIVRFDHRPDGSLRSVTSYFAAVDYAAQSNVSASPPAPRAAADASSSAGAGAGAAATAPVSSKAPPPAAVLDKVTLRGVASLLLNAPREVQEMRELMHVTGQTSNAAAALITPVSLSACSALRESGEPEICPRDANKPQFAAAESVNEFDLFTAPRPQVIILPIDRSQAPLIASRVARYERAYGTAGVSDNHDDDEADADGGEVAAATSGGAGKGKGEGQRGHVDLSELPDYRIVQLPDSMRTGDPSRLDGFLDAEDDVWIVPEAAANTWPQATALAASASAAAAAAAVASAPEPAPSSAAFAPPAPLTAPHDTKSSRHGHSHSHHHELPCARTARLCFGVKGIFFSCAGGHRLRLQQLEAQLFTALALHRYEVAAALHSLVHAKLDPQMASAAAAAAVGGPAAMAAVAALGAAAMTPISPITLPGALGIASRRGAGLHHRKPHTAAEAAEDADEDDDEDEDEDDEEEAEHQAGEEEDEDAEMDGAIDSALGGSGSGSGIKSTGTVNSGADGSAPSPVPFVDVPAAALFPRSAHTLTAAPWYNMQLRWRCVAPAGGCAQEPQSPTSATFATCGASCGPSCGAAPPFAHVGAGAGAGAGGSGGDAPDLDAAKYPAYVGGSLYSMSMRVNGMKAAAARVSQLVSLGSSRMRLVAAAPATVLHAAPPAHTPRTTSILHAFTTAPLHSLEAGPAAAATAASAAQSKSVAAAFAGPAAAAPAPVTSTSTSGSSGSSGPRPHAPHGGTLALDLRGPIMPVPAPAPVDGTQLHVMVSRPARAAAPAAAAAAAAALGPLANHPALQVPGIHIDAAMATPGGLTASLLPDLHYSWASLFDV